MKQIALILTAHFFLLNTFGQITFSSLDDVFNYADKNSFIYRQGAVKERINNSEQSISKSALLPNVNVFSLAEYYPVIGSMVVPGKLLGVPGNSYQKVQFGLPYNFVGGVEVSMPVVSFEKWEQVKLVRLQSLASTLDTKTQIENLHINLARLYYEALLYKKLIVLNEENEKVTKELTRVVEERKKNNVLNPADYNRSQNLSLGVINAGVEYRKLYAVTLINLKAALNLGHKDSLVLRETLTEVEAALPGNEADITNRAAVKEAEAQVAVANQVLAASKKSALPKVSLYGKYAYHLQVKPGKDNQQVNFDVSSVGLRLDVPIFSGKYYQLQTKKSGAQVQLAKLQEEQVKVSLQQEHANWQTNYKSAINKQQQLKRKIHFAADNLRIAQLGFKEGVTEFDELSNIFMENIQVQIESLQNTTDGLVYKLLLTRIKTL
ncbi:MAG TPA: TolC family protein [Chitinophagaceae bacterium]|nr:TolC family protein [Chitinophagaceae bacterium]